jgi:23S rRNA U2552 (ribose-2'-O)-methylase RlmE/FtsJ
VIAGCVEPADVPALLERARAMILAIATNEAKPVVCEVGALRADLAAVDALARLTHAARRLEIEIILSDASPALRELLGMIGLSDVLRFAPESGFETRR